MRDARYTISHVGKWHLGGLHLTHPRDRGQIDLQHTFCVNGARTGLIA
jgi:hypothetical protein